MLTLKNSKIDIKIEFPKDKRHLWEAGALGAIIGTLDSKRQGLLSFAYALAQIKEIIKKYEEAKNEN